MQAGGETVIAIDDPAIAHGHGHAVEIAMLDQPGNAGRVLLRRHRKIGVAVVIGRHQKAVPQGGVNVISGDPAITARPMRIILDPALEREVEDVAFTDTNSHVPLRPGANTKTGRGEPVEKGLSVRYIKVFLSHPPPPTRRRTRAFRLKSRAGQMRKFASRHAKNA